MIAYAVDKAEVAKHPPRERASSSNGGKASANEDQATTTAKYPPNRGQHALGSKASTREGPKETSAAKHPLGNGHHTRQKPAREEAKATQAENHPPEKPKTAKHPS